jgi:hypothetical protein
MTGALPAEVQAGQRQAHTLPRDRAIVCVPQILGQEGSRPDRCTLAQRPWGLGQYGLQQRINPLRHCGGPTAPEALGKTFPPRRRASGMENFDPVIDSLARHVSACGHRNQTFALGKPEQSLRAAQCLGRAGA